MITNAGSGVIKTMTFPVSLGLAPTSREYPEELVVQLTSSLLTISPSDIVLGRTLKSLGTDRLAIRAMSRLQKLGIKGQRILEKIIRRKSLTKLETELWEQIQGISGISTAQLRDTSNRLFTKNKIRFDDAGDIAKIIDDALTDVTGVRDWTKVIDKFDDMPITSKDTQLLVTKEVARQLKEMRQTLSKLTDIDPDAGTLTRWGILSDADKLKVSKAYKKLLDAYEENAISFGAGAARRLDSLVEVEEVFTKAGIDVNELFESGDDIVNFLANNPQSGAKLLLFLNQPVIGATPSSTLIRQTKEPWDIDTEFEKLDIDIITGNDEKQKKTIVPLEIELPDLTPKELSELKKLGIEIPDIKTGIEQIPDVKQDVTQTTTPITDLTLDEPTVIVDVPPIEPAPITPPVKPKKKGDPGSRPNVFRALVGGLKEKYRVVFNYRKGKDESFTVTARSFPQALSQATQLRRVKYVPSEVDVAKVGK